MEPHGISHSHNHYMPTQNHPLLLSSIAMAGVNVPNQFLLTAFEEEFRDNLFRNTMDTTVAYDSFRAKCRYVGLQTELGNRRIQPNKVCQDCREYQGVLTVLHQGTIG